MSVTERQEVIAELRRRLPIGDQTDRDRYRYLLLRLGDEQTINGLIADIRSDDRQRVRDAERVVSSVNNPALIPHIAEFLYYPEGMGIRTEPGSDLVEDTRPRWAATRIRRIVWAADGFSPEVKEWVKSLKAYEDIRQLWEQNKEAFLRHDYAGVKPPKTVRLPEPPVPTNQVFGTSISAANAVQPPKIAPVLPSSSAKETEPSRWPLWFGAGTLALVAVVAITVIWRMKEDSRLKSEDKT